MRGNPRKVDVECYVFPSDTLFFRMDCGSAESDDGKFELSTNVGSGEPIVRLPDGRWVTLTWEQIVRAASAAGRATT